MDPNSLQQIAGTAYVQKLRQELQPQARFAEYDVLTPDEPGQVWQFIRRFLNRASNIVTSVFFKHHQTFSRQASNALPSDGQTALFYSEIIVKQEVTIGDHHV
jgi:hypothetical protein